MAMLNNQRVTRLISLIELFKYFDLIDLYWFFEHPKFGMNRFAAPRRKLPMFHVRVWLPPRAQAC